MSAPTHYCAVYVILVKDNKVLLMRRANTGQFDGFWAFPAGHVERTESLHHAVARELQEETGLVVSPEKFIFRHVMYRCRPERSYINYFFECTDWSGDPIIAEPHKCDGMQWVSFTDLPENTAPDIKQAVQCVLNNQPFSDTSW